VVDEEEELLASSERDADEDDDGAVEDDVAVEVGRTRDEKLEPLGSRPSRCAGG